MERFLLWILHSIARGRDELETCSKLQMVQDTTRKGDLETLDCIFKG